MPRPILLVIALVPAGCSDRHSRMEPPPPEDSGAGRPGLYVRDGNDRTDGRGHPDRLPAGLKRAVRGDVEVRLEQTITTGGRILVNVEVRNRGKDRPLALGDWTAPGRAAMRDDAGKAYPAVPPSPERDRANREWEAAQKNPAWRYGAGPVTADYCRVTNLEFEGNVPPRYLDLDLDGGPVGFADPILFRIPAEMFRELLPVP
jgi:hypothetical protein